MLCERHAYPLTGMQNNDSTHNNYTLALRRVGSDWRTDMQFLAARSLWMMFLLLRYSIPREMSNMNWTNVCRDRS